MRLPFFCLDVLNDIEEDLLENRRYSHISQRPLMYQINCCAFVKTQTVVINIVSFRILW